MVLQLHFTDTELGGPRGRELCEVTWVVSGGSETLT